MNLKKWLYVVFINLLIVATLGLVLRYKITFSLPFIHQKFLQHGHSHFALTGWITQSLMVFLSYTVSNGISPTHFKKHQWILFANLFSAMGMLIAFPIQGYANVSIAFSSLSILVSYIFAIRIWKDINHIKLTKPGYKWFRAALIFLVLSSIGIFLMVYLMLSKNMNPTYHLGAVYLFLHLQYNGWFVFACFGLLINRMYDAGVQSKHTKTFFWINALACIPAYFLSAPWLPIPAYIFPLIVAAAALQFLSWLWVVYKLKERAFSILKGIPTLAKWLLSFSAFAYTVKVFLQLGSAVPALSIIAFGFRPIVVAYLHLVFLGVISLFIFAYCFGWLFTSVSKWAKRGMILFVLGIILSETALMIQGLFAINYHPVPYINEIIFAVTVLMFLGILIFNFAIHQKSNVLSISENTYLK